MKKFWERISVDNVQYDLHVTIDRAELERVCRDLKTRYPDTDCMGAFCALDVEVDVEKCK